MQLFKYFDFTQSMSVVTIAINRATTELIAFAVMFLIVFLAFAQFGYVVFGTYMQDFSSFSDSLYASVNCFNSYAVFQQEVKVI